MKTLKYFAMAAVAIIAMVFASCGGGEPEKPIEVSVDNTTIGGKLSQYFSLVDKTYKYKKGIIDEVTVELTCIEPLPENMKAYIGMEVLDENGTVISVCKPEAWSFRDYELLQQASPGQTVTIKIENHENVRDEQPTKIRLSSIVEEKESASSSSSSKDDDTSSLFEDSDDDDNDSAQSSSSSAGSQDWDELLNSYEQCVDKYISYAKKAAKGDMSALLEYPSLMDKANDLSDKMKNAEGEMSPSQWSRYIKITNKMTQAAVELL